MYRTRLLAAVAAVTVAGGAAAALALGPDDRTTAVRAPTAPAQPVPGREAPVAGEPSFALQTVARGLVRPTGVASAPGDGSGLWVTEQTGRLLRIAGDRRRVVLDLSDDVSVGAEQGLLGLAFHPDFARNRRLYVNYTDRAGDTRVVEHTLGGGRRELLFVDQPEENHNGGALLFAMDGRLLVGMGDGGGAFDPGDRAQDPGERLGKVLVADVDGPGRPRWETLLSGMRNPWRIWMDPALNELWIGDVGQDQAEEIDRVLYEPDEPPKNLGWPAWEGDQEIAPDRMAPDASPVAPIAVYSHEEGCSVTGGLIYRGRALSRLDQRYVYGDFCTGTIWSLRPTPKLGVEDIRRERETVPQLTSIGTDPRGELVFTTGAGELLRAVAPRGR